MDWTKQVPQTRGIYLGYFIPEERVVPVDVDWANGEEKSFLEPWIPGYEYALEWGDFKLWFGPIEFNLPKGFKIPKDTV